MPIHPWVQFLKSIPTPRQQTPEWFAKRRHLLTSSRFPAALGQDPKNMTKQRLFRIMTGLEPERPGNMFTQHGINTEDEARRLFEERTGKRVVEFGCLTHRETHPDDSQALSQLGASCDGITEEEAELIEIKCPLRREILYDQEGIALVPGHYDAQIRGLMFILELHGCWFIQYKPETPCRNEEFAMTWVPRDREWEKENVPRLLEFHARVAEFNAIESRMQADRQRREELLREYGGRPRGSGSSGPVRRRSPSEKAKEEEPCLIVSDSE